MRTVQIAPSLLAADFTRLGEQIAAAEAGGAELLHIDVMDGRFVPNITMGPFIVEAVHRVTKLPLDVHLMIVEPEHYLSAFADAGAASISVHYETCPNLHRTLQQIHNLGCKAGVALNPHTPASVLSEIMDVLDFVNIMTVNPGFGGQHFLTTMMSKVARLRAMMGETGRELDLEVDGGINASTAPTAVQAGANILIAGTSVFNAEFSVQQGIAALRASLQ